MKHYLLTITPHPSVHVHGYVMTDDKRYVMATLDEMMTYIEKQLGPLRLPIALSTELSTGADVVRRVICDLSNEAREALATATDFHKSIFVMRADDPLDKELMDLH